MGIRNMVEMPEVTQLRELLSLRAQQRSCEGAWARGFMLGLACGIVVTSIIICITIC